MRLKFYRGVLHVLEAICFKLDDLIVREKQTERDRLW